MGDDLAEAYRELAEASANVRYAKLAYDRAWRRIEEMQAARQSPSSHRIEGEGVVSI